MICPVSGADTGQAFVSAWVAPPLAKCVHRLGQVRRSEAAFVFVRGIDAVGELRDRARRTQILEPVCGYANDRKLTFVTVHSAADAVRISTTLGLHGSDRRLDWRLAQQRPRPPPAQRINYRSSERLYTELSMRGG